MLTLTVKKSQGEFVPVGEQEFIAAIEKQGEGWLVVIVDEEGYAKSQSKILAENDAREILNKAISDNIPEYTGQVRLV